MEPPFQNNRLQLPIVWPVNRSADVHNSQFYSEGAVFRNGNAWLLGNSIQGT